MPSPRAGTSACARRTSPPRMVTAPRRPRPPTSRPRPRRPRGPRRPRRPNRPPSGRARSLRSPPPPLQRPRPRPPPTPRPRPRPPPPRPRRARKRVSDVAYTPTAAEVKELRERTQAGMMDCKRALEETGGDMDAAVKALREKGIASASKRAGRGTGEGVVETYIHATGKIGAMVEVDCETDFVARND